jgi:hypothetical protein
MLFRSEKKSQGSPCFGGKESSDQEQIRLCTGMSALDGWVESNNFAGDAHHSFLSVVADRFIWN